MNLLIAKFICYKTNEDSFKGESGFWENPNVFQNDWNYLMIAVEKCTDIWDEYEFDTEKRLKCEEEIWNIDGTISDFLNADIEAIYGRVINFINWYNERKLEEDT